MTPKPGNVDEENAQVLLAGIIGTGFKIAYPFPLQDYGADAVVLGALSVVGVHVKVHGILLIETTLSWKTSTGIKHKSSARYLIPLDRAEELGNLPPLVKTESGTTPGDFSDEAVSSNVDAIIADVAAAQARCELFGAEWRQTYPGCMRELGTDVGLAASQQHAAYHIYSVRDAQRTEPALTGMLEVEDSALPKPEAVVAIARWLREHPAEAEEALK